MSGVADGRRVLVAGLGVSGLAAARAAAGAGAIVTVHDAVPAVVERAMVELAGLVTVTRDPIGLLSSDQLPDVVVASPGLAPGTGVLATAAQMDVEIWSEPELAWRLLAGRTRVLAITGTNGKTTTTELLAACLDAPAVGNIGRPLSALVEDPPPLVVAELSSFQLHYTRTLRTDVGVVLNVADDHLDWHGDRASYMAAKARVWHGQRAQSGGGLGDRDWAVTNLDDPGCRQLASAHPPPAGRVGFTLAVPPPGSVGVQDDVVVERIRSNESTPVIGVDALGVRGHHNVANAAAAVAAALVSGMAPTALGPALTAARVGAHRLEVVAERDGVMWINDSKATNPHAAAAALRSFDSVVWIAGGLGKGVSFDPLAAEMADRVWLALTIGAAGAQLAAMTRAHGVETVEAGDLQTAVAVARDRARPGDVVLLAPACASMDQFANYAERGDRFRELVAAGSVEGVDA